MCQVEQKEGFDEKDKIGKEEDERRRHNRIGKGKKGR
jgi:hypothetical protein